MLLPRTNHSEFASFPNSSYEQPLFPVYDANLTILWKLRLVAVARATCNAREHSLFQSDEDVGLKCSTISCIIPSQCFPQRGVGGSRPLSLVNVFIGMCSAL